LLMGGLRLRSPVWEVLHVTPHFTDMKDLEMPYLESR